MPHLKQDFQSSLQLSKITNCTEKMKRFSKIKFLEIVAPLNFKLNPDTLAFESSPLLHLRSWWILFVKSIVPFKIYYSTFFERFVHRQHFSAALRTLNLIVFFCSHLFRRRQSIVQLWIGNM